MGFGKSMRDGTEHGQSGCGAANTAMGLIIALFAANARLTRVRSMMSLRLGVNERHQKLGGTYRFRIFWKMTTSKRSDASRYDAPSGLTEIAIERYITALSERSCWREKGP